MIQSTKSRDSGEKEACAQREEKGEWRADRRSGEDVHTKRVRVVHAGAPLPPSYQVNRFPPGIFLPYIHNKTEAKNAYIQSKKMPQTR